MLSKEKFVLIMTRLHKKYLNNDKFYDNWYNLLGSTPDWVFENDYYSEAIEFLEMLMEDKNHLISYFTSDCGWDFNNFQISIKDKKTKDTTIYTISDFTELYDVIIEMNN
jgi:hypothetical protein